MTNTTTQPQQSSSPAPANGAPATALATQAAAATVTLAPRTGEIIRVGFDTIQGFEALQRIAKAFCVSSLVPEAYRGEKNIANAIIAVEMAMRMHASPLMVMQNLYVVHGRPGWSGQFYIASFNNCGRFSPIRYRFTGEKGKDTWGCVAWARELTTNEIVESAEVSIAIAKSEGWYAQNKKWQSIPQHMLMLRSGAWLVRTVAPELTMGLKTREEIEDVDGGDEQFTPPPALAALPEATDVTPAPSTPGPSASPDPVAAADTIAEARRKLAEAAAGAAPAQPEPGSEG